MAAELPHHLAILLNRLCKSARLFLKLFKKDEQRMTAFVEELQEMSNEFKQMKDKTFWQSAGGTVLGGVGAGVLSLAAVGLGTGKVAVPAGGVTLLMGGATAITGLTTISNAIGKKSMTEKELIKTVAQLNAQLMVMFRPLRDHLEEMKKVSEEMVKKSSLLVTTVGAPANSALSEIENFQQLLIGSNETSDSTLFISQSATQSQRTVDEFAKMRNALKEFEEN